METKCEGFVEVVKPAHRVGLVTWILLGWKNYWIVLVPIGLVVFGLAMETHIIACMPGSPLLSEDKNITVQPDNTTCTLKLVDPKFVEYHSGHRFYSALKEMESPQEITLSGDHMKLCDEDERASMNYGYCVPLSGRKDTPFCTAGDRSDLLSVPSPKSVCYASVLHMLMVDVYEELKATGNAPLITFGTLLGAVRNGSMIPFTEDTDIAFVDRLHSKDVLVEALRQKGYHMFFYKIWRVCVAPTHPLAPRIYDPDHSLTRSFATPYVDLYQMQKVNASLWDMQEMTGSNGRFLPTDKVEPFSQVTINGMPFDTVHDPHYLLKEAYGANYMVPRPRRSAIKQIEDFKAAERAKTITQNTTRNE